MPVSHQAFFHAATSTVSYLVWDEATREAAIIDPVLDYDPRSATISTASADEILSAVRDRNLTLRYLLETHAHADHLSASHYLRGLTGAPVVIGEMITEVQSHFGALFEAEDVIPDGSAFDRLVADGETLALGQSTIGVMHTPGHTAACVTYLIGDGAYVGDTLFMPDYGTARTDFPGGDAATLYASIRKILNLPAHTRIFVGHDYLPEGRSTYAWETSVAQQRAENLHVHDGVSADAFVALREARDATLAPPVLILPSLQINIRAGALPPPTDKGGVFLSLPVTAPAGMA